MPLFTKANSRRLYVLGFGILVSAGTIAAATVGDSSSVATAPSPSRPVVMVAPGLVEPVSEEVSISNVTQGTIQRIPVTEGEHVVAGQVLAELYDDDLRAVVAAAKAQLDLNRSQKEKAVNGPRAEERREASANLQDAEAVLSMAQMTFERQSALVPTRATTVESFDKARTGVQSAKARRQAMAERLALLNIGSRQEDIDIAEANVQLAAAKLQQAQAELEKSFIRSPIDGTVLRLRRRVGEQVSSTFPSIIVVVGDISQLRVRAEIDETDVGRIRIGQRAYVTADAYGALRFAGTITKIASRMGKKAVHTDDPAEKIDAKVLDTLITLDAGADMPVGLRVDVFVDADLPKGPATAALEPPASHQP
jgi:HlyD family secretion protein